MTRDDDRFVSSPVTRRAFLGAAGATAVSAAASFSAPVSGGNAKVRYAIVGAGHRGSGMWGAEALKRHADTLDLVALCDLNPERAEAANALMGTKAPVFTDLDRMLSEARPEKVAVCTVDASHASVITRLLDRGVEVVTEKPMVTEVDQLQSILEAEKRSRKKVAMAFNYRYSPKNELIWQLLRNSDLGRVTSVDFSWYLDVTHGADYFRRWHRLKAKSGSLWVHKATHHFDLVNWWLGADPVEVFAASSLRRYGRNGNLRHSHCRECPHRGKCEFFFDLTKNPRLMALYAGPAGSDGYHRDGCVFREDCDIYDTMSAVITYTSGTSMSYSLNAFMPFEGFRLAFNCEKGRIEVRDWERQGWEVPYETEILVARSFQKEPERITLQRREGGHSGGDPRLLDAVFGKNPVADQLRVPDSRAGAMSCLTGIAARMSSESGKPVKIAGLLPAAGLGT
ncbi:MAG: Gfo/Idh/MocA family oxidoreductase [Acidobacteria bacterium]|nr:Gfo/Idh/MocA family oxidoreductase [Acidobacteriota bacterium]